MQLVSEVLEAAAPHIEGHWKKLNHIAGTQRAAMSSALALNDINILNDPVLGFKVAEHILEAEKFPRTWEDTVKFWRGLIESAKAKEI